MWECLGPLVVSYVGTCGSQKGLFFFLDCSFEALHHVSRWRQHEDKRRNVSGRLHTFSYLCLFALCVAWLWYQPSVCRHVYYLSILWNLVPVIMCRHVQESPWFTSPASSPELLSSPPPFLPHSLSVICSGVSAGTECGSDWVSDSSWGEGKRRRGEGWEKMGKKMIFLGGGYCQYLVCRDCK